MGSTKVQVKYYEHLSEVMIPYSNNKYLSYDIAREVLGRCKIPKELRTIVINEMIFFGYLERINQRELRII